MIRVYIGHDAREEVAFSVLVHSIHRHAGEPVSVAPVMLSQLGGLYTREKHPLQSTSFSFSRFLTPCLSGYTGWSLFMDCDMLLRDDIAKLWALRDDRYAVMVVKHEHVPRETEKFLGMPQSRYEKKNWSSVMLFNNARCTALSPHYVNSASGLELHQFKWLDGDEAIGTLPSRWNHLVGYDAPRDDAALVHFTLGGPYFADYADCEYADAWREDRGRMLATAERKS